MIRETANFTSNDFRILTNSVSNYTMKRYHFHDEFELYYLISGSRDYFIADHTYHVEQGNLVLIRSYDLHKTIDTGESHSRVLISFSSEFLALKDSNSLINACFESSQVLSLDSPTKQHLESILKEMIVDSSKKPSFYLARLQCSLAKLLMESSDYIQKTKKNTSTSKTANETVFRIIQYLKLNYHRQLTLAELSEEFFISRYYITRIFKKATGFTIFEYVHSLRVIEAQRLLKDTPMKVIDISQSVGYSNVSNFSKVFKSITGMSPMKYRKNHINALILS